MQNFITIEGCDGVGKTYQTAKLKEYCLSTNQTDIIFTREPGGSKVAEKIREIILDAKNDLSDLTEAFLYAAARVQHLDDVVIPALAKGKTVICDRFVHSSYAYQGFGRGLGYEKVKLLNALAVGEYMPEYTFFLDLSPEQAFRRKGGSDKSDRLENCGKDFYQKVYDGYRAVIAENPGRFVVIDASGERNETHGKLVAEMRKKGIIK